MTTTDRPPVWLLDIDGVINACTKNPDRSVWPADQWHRNPARGGDRVWPILYAQPVIDFIAGVHAAGRAEIRWHTTWQEYAQNLAEAVGLPTFPVQDAPEYRTWDRGRAAGWWKLPAARRVLVDEGRPLVWTDDDITWELVRERRDEFRALGSALLIAPSDLTGLTPKHLHQIGEFLDRSTGHREVAEAAQGSDAPDLMADLRASLAASRRARLAAIAHTNPTRVEGEGR